MARQRARRTPSPRETEEASVPRGPLQIRYVRLADAVLWERNPKRHDMGGIIESIRQHGFRDAPIYDSALGAIVAGNGRTTALEEMRRVGDPPPQGVAVDDVGDWWMPMQFGIDAQSVEQAEAFGLDHNLLTATGGDLGLSELAGLFDRDRLVEILHEGVEAGVRVVSFDPDDVQALLHPPTAASQETSGGPMGGATTVCTCPNCGHRFVRGSTTT